MDSPLTAPDAKVVRDAIVAQLTRNELSGMQINVRTASEHPGELKVAVSPASAGDRVQQALTAAGYHARPLQPGELMVGA
jgi:hypothetical protein